MWKIILCLLGKHDWVTDTPINSNGEYMESPQIYRCRRCQFGYKKEFKWKI